MKIIKFFLLILFILLHVKNSGYGQVRYITYTTSGEYLQYAHLDYLAINNNESDNFAGDFAKDPGLEGPLRRFEITFFISAPFVFILTFATLHTYAVIKKHNSDVNVWKDYKPALLISTFGISSVIAAREAWITMESNNKKKAQVFNERTFYFYANKNF